MRQSHLFTKTRKEAPKDEVAKNAQLLIRAGEKFADSDLIGIPLRIIVSDKALEKGGYEVKERATGAVSHLAEKELLSRLGK